MTIQDFIKQGHKWIELKGVPVRDSHSKSIVFIHNHFFEGKELEFQNELISNFMKLCPDKEWSWRVYGGDTPDADIVDWIYTQTAEIVSGGESVMPASEITIEGVKVGDKVRHNLTGDRVATVTGIRRVQGYKWEGEITVYRLDFGESVKGPFGMEMNGGEYQREAFMVVPDYYSEYQRLGHQEARPTEWIEKATSEEREAYYRACVELERMAGDGLPLVIRADSADLSVNPWNALEKRVKTARVFHLGDRVKMHYPYQCNEVTGVINRIRFDEGSLSLGGWCTHYDIRFDEEYQRPNNFGGKDVGVGVISPERIELVERAEFCPEPAAEWLQPGEKVAHYLDYGDGTGDWLIGNVTGYELCDDGTVIVIYGEYRTPLKGMVKYQPEMDGEAA